MAGKVSWISTESKLHSVHLYHKRYGAFDYVTMNGLVGVTLELCSEDAGVVALVFLGQSETRDKLLGFCKVASNGVGSGPESKYPSLDSIAVGPVPLIILLPTISQQ